MAYDRLVTSLDRLLGSRLDAGPPLDFPDGPVGDRCREVVTRTGHGSFMDGFVHLFVQPLRDLDPCLRAWSFLDDALRRRWVIGKNALGALIAMDDPTGGDGTLRVALVDPLRVSVFSPEDLTLDTLHDRWLGQQRLPGFFDDGLYRQVSSAVGEPLDFGLMLAPKHPMGRGGRLEACNVQVEPLLEYYRSTGPIYERTLQRTQESQARPEGAPAAPPPPQDVGDPTLASILSEQRDPNAPLDDGSPPLCRAAVAGALLQARSCSQQVPTLASKAPTDARRCKWRSTDTRRSSSGAIATPPERWPARTAAPVSKSSTRRPPQRRTTSSSRSAVRSVRWGAS